MNQARNPGQLGGTVLTQAAWSFVLPAMAVLLTGLLTGCSVFHPRQLEAEAQKAVNAHAYHRADRLYRRLLDMSKPGSERAQTMTKLAGVCDQEGKFLESESLYKQAIGIDRQPGGTSFEASYRLGRFYMDQARYEDAIPLWEELLVAVDSGTATTLVKPDTSYGERQLDCLRNLGSAYYNAGKLESAAPIYHTLIELQKTHGDSTELAELESTHGTIASRLGRIGEAEQARRRAEAVLTRLSDSELSNVQELHRLVQCCMNIGCPDAAESLAKRYVNTNSKRMLSVDEQILVASVHRLSTEQSHGDPLAMDYFVSPCCCSWSQDRMPLRVFVEEEPGVRAFRKSFRRAVPECFADWSIASDLRVRYTFVNDPRKADIVCTLTRYPAGDALHQAAITGVRCHHDQMSFAHVKVFANPGKTFAYLRAVCLHEIGHALGINSHSSNAYDVMYYFGSGRSCALSPRDKATIRKLYQDET